MNRSVITAIGVGLSAIAFSMTLPDAAYGLAADEARMYMLKLINQDRKDNGLGPVDIDETASKAAQMHADDLAHWFGRGHISKSGADPRLRYSRAGGTHFNQENVSNEWFSSTARVRTEEQKQTDKEGPPFPLSKDADYKKEVIERMESRMINEKPPQDGHRRNILDALHNKVGVAFAASSDKKWDFYICVQEFVNQYGEFAPIPSKAAKNIDFTLSGVLDKGLTVSNVSVEWKEFPQEISEKDIKKGGSYNFVADSVAVYWPPPFNSPAPIVVSEDNGRCKFSVHISVDGPAFKPGLYYVTVWAEDEQKKKFIASSRVVEAGEPPPAEREK